MGNVILLLHKSVRIELARSVYLSKGSAFINYINSVLTSALRVTGSILLNIGE